MVTHHRWDAPVRREFYVKQRVKPDVMRCHSHSYTAYRMAEFFWIPTSSSNKFRSDARKLEMMTENNSRVLTLKHINQANCPYRRLKYIRMGKNVVNRNGNKTYKVTLIKKQKGFLNIYYWNLMSIFSYCADELKLNALPPPCRQASGCLCWCL